MEDCPPSKCILPKLLMPTEYNTLVLNAHSEVSHLLGEVYRQ
jgi:hypothetical protein